MLQNPYRTQSVPTSQNQHELAKKWLARMDFKRLFQAAMYDYAKLERKRSREQLNESGYGLQQTITGNRGDLMKGKDSKAISSVETDLRIIKKNLDRLTRRLKPDNEKSLIPEIAFTLSTASKILDDAIATLGNQFDR